MPPAAPRLTRVQKATIIVRLLQAEGIKISLADLPEELQVALTQEMSAMRIVNRATLRAVVSEFVEELEQLGLSFPHGVGGALSALEDSLSENARKRLRMAAGQSPQADPWDVINTVDTAKLLPIIEEESVEIAAVMLSKLSVAKSAEILGKLPGEKARRIAYAVSKTTAVTPETVRRIGEAVLAQFQNEAPSAFDVDAVDRVGAILNVSPASTREEVLEGLKSEDEKFAEEVRKKIFTFANIAERVDTRDIPKITREVDPQTLVTALAAASQSEAEAKAAEFILDNMSQRMAAQLREEIEALGKVKPAEGEAAMGEVVAAIRALEEAGEISLIVEDDEA